MNIKETLLDLYSRRQVNEQARQMRELILADGEKYEDQKYQWLMMEKNTLMQAISSAEEAEMTLSSLDAYITRLAILDKCRDDPLLEENE